MPGLGKAPLWQVLIIKALVILCYVNLAYFVSREDFGLLLTHYFIVFAGFLYFLNRAAFSFGFLAFMGLVFRLLFIASTPELSNDYYRFIWDGRLLLEGFNPYLSYPLDFLQGTQAEVIDQGAQLADGMGNLNASHYTVYPPLNQLCFFLAALVGSKSIMASVVVLRLIMISADIGIWWIGRKLLRHLDISERCIYFYLLNPFVILEFTGNLHFEGLMVFFLLWAVYLLLTQKWIQSAVVLGLSVSVKLIPLIFLPLLFKKMGFKKAVSYYLFTGLTVLILFSPFLSQALIANFFSSIELYFQNFEFNASIYYIVRAIGYEVTGYNIIQTAGRILPLITLAGILTLSFFRKNQGSRTLVASMLWAVTIYYGLSTTVHPWYIAVPLALSVLSGYRFPVVWSGLVILSYGAYSQAGFQENLWLVSLEYAVVFGFMIYELWKGVSPPLHLKPTAHA